MQSSWPVLFLRRRRNWTSGVAGTAIAIAAIAFVSRAHVIEPQRFVESLRAIGTAPFVLGLAGALGVVALQSLRWWYVSRPVVGDLRYGHALAAVFVGGFLNASLPARAGDVARLQFLSDRARVSRATLLGTELVDLWADKSGWIAAFVLLLPTGSPPGWMLRAVLTFGGVAAALLVVAWLARARLAHAARGDGWRARLARGLAANRAPRLVFAALGVAALPWLWEAGAIHLVAYAAGVPLAWLQAFAVLTAFNVAMLVPVPGNLGLHEAASSAVLVSFGIPLDRALAFALVYHASQLLPSMAAGSALLMFRRPAPARTAPDIVLDAVGRPNP